ncbi:MAG: alpha/beta hydrolase [Candidatus Accumulibacter sp.]|nr:alpha/beta hydrolase [Accumulibacter sp.]
MIETVLVVWLIAMALWFGIAFFYLRGPDVRVWDQAGEATIERFVSTDDQGHRAAVAKLASLIEPAMGAPSRQRLAMLRRGMDDLFGDRRYAVSFIPVTANGVPGEWVLAPSADPDRRLLYIHGGAFAMGSSRSHRVITARLAEITGGAILSIDYRLRPEHPRRAGIDDCRSAYDWLVANGPQGPAPAKVLFVAGDSAGGNLTLSLLAALRDEGARRPDAAVALSPVTDMTLGSPSIKSNRLTDPLLGPVLAPLLWLPRSTLLWIGWLQSRTPPARPLISPLFGDLANLPPILIQASDAEMLRDDCIRYTNKARAAGSPVRLQLWSRVVHVWQIFYPDLAEARQAFDEIDKFLKQVAPSAPGKSSVPDEQGAS